MLRKFFEEEAELGSDNEDNDYIRKNIDRFGDEEEKEDELDDDLGDLVDQPSDDEEIEDANEELYQKYQREMEQKDRDDINRTLAAVLFGNNNKKRKRFEVEGLDNYDDGAIRRKRLMEERPKQL
jgi:hypothetical protein